MAEQWRDIPGWEGLYQVSNIGQVRSLDREIRCINGVLKRLRGKVLTPAAAPSGHMSVVLGRGNTKQVHQLVMSAFVGPKPAGMEVLHKDHNPGNNRRSNLKYGTRSENVLMDYDAGVRIRKQVVSTDRDGNRRVFASVTEAANALGVLQPTISQALKRQGRLRKSRCTVEFV